MSPVDLLKLISISDSFRACFKVQYDLEDFQQPFPIQWIFVRTVDIAWMDDVSVALSINGLLSSSFFEVLLGMLSANVAARRRTFYILNMP